MLSVRASSNNWWLFVKSLIGQNKSVHSFCCFFVFCFKKCIGKLKWIMNKTMWKVQLIEREYLFNFFLYTKSAKYAIIFMNHFQWKKWSLMGNGCDKIESILIPSFSYRECMRWFSITRDCLPLLHNTTTYYIDCIFARDFFFFSCRVMIFRTLVNFLLEIKTKKFRFSMWLI